jgi:hypothetical protein
MPRILNIASGWAPVEFEYQNSPGCGDSPNEPIVLPNLNQISYLLPSMANPFPRGRTRLQATFERRLGNRTPKRLNIVDIL